MKGDEHKLVTQQKLAAVTGRNISAALVTKHEVAEGGILEITIAGYFERSNDGQSIRMQGHDEDANQPPHHTKLLPVDRRLQFAGTNS